ncbi:hypothetical protein [Morganella sp. GD04133]|uniref:hypothetical protein n=1 Tax=Morganella sp. GD04133 TaxID=2975435 RepID=UPI00244717FE|nr:hypothetical protein [Morganella sp. GD04133]MDH0357137.1 hypothetical protein [Morganella sp. GD04133]
MKFKVGDKVYIELWDVNGTICAIDDKDVALPYSVEDEYGVTSWWLEDELELINEQIS